MNGQNAMKKRLIKLLLPLIFVFGIMFSSASPFVMTAEAATTSQNNIVARADYMYNATWVCQKTVKGWNSKYTFYKGNTYHLPYAWPVSSGAYIGYGISVENFLNATKSASNAFYTRRSYLSGASYSYSTYYGNDCSGFVSYCWGISRTTTYGIPNRATYIGRINKTNATKTLQLGDALNSNSVGHVVLVTGLKYDSSGNITQIEITEQTPPQMKRSYYTPSQLSTKYYSNYYIYRYKGSVPAAPKTTKDTTKPTISNVKVSNVTADSYKVTCTVKDNVGVTKVLFPTWTEKNGQDDVVWHTGTISGTTASFTVKRSAHKSEYGKYNTHIYAYDAAGNSTGVPSVGATLVKDTTKPTISNVKVSNVTSDSYKVTCTVKDNVGVTKVLFPTWTEKNGQDDVVWHTGTISGSTATFTVKRSAHNNEYGKYHTHIYVYDAAGNNVHACTNATLTKPATATKTVYYPACTGYTGTSLYDGLRKSGYTGTLSVAAVKPIATLNSISNYTGTASQNLKLLKLLKAGKLIKTAAYYPACTGYTGGSLYDGLRKSGYTGTLSVAAVKPIAVANGISTYTGTDYTGTAAQNTALLKLLKAGKLIKP